MSAATETALRLLRAEVQRLAGHRTDRVFLVQKLDALEAWLKELERQHATKKLNLRSGG
ncbi:hypothetical protein [Methylorubrum sp. SB2]|uniref:hypothetical protein n=1 Tax=Methylorubrum subtropicum TaxID=3138812 RepID=UPI00313C3229